MNASLGTRRHCPECQSKFFDMGALEVKCPKCSFVFPIRLTSREVPLSVPALAAAPMSKKAKHYRLDKADDEAIEGLGAVIELEELDDDLYPDLDHLEEVESHQEIPEVDVNGDDADDEMFIDEIADGDVHLIDELDDESHEEHEAR